MEFSFIPLDIGDGPRKVSKTSRKKIRSQAMRDSWRRKKSAKEQPTSRPQPPIEGEDIVSGEFDAGVPYRSVFVHDPDETDYYEQLAKKINQKQRTGLPTPPSSVESRESSPLTTVEHAFALSSATEEPIKLRPWLGTDTDDDDNIEVIERDTTQLQRNVGTASPQECSSLDPFTSAATSISPQMHYYLQYYLNSIVPLLHPFQEQQDLLTGSLKCSLARSPLILFSTLTMASMRIDNYSNKYDELLLYTKWPDSELPVPHSFRFKQKTIQTLLAMVQHPERLEENDGWCEIVFALICLVSYDLLVQNRQEAIMHLRALRQLLASKGGLHKICPPVMNPKIMSHMLSVVRGMKLYATANGETHDMPSPFDEKALCYRLATYSRFPALVGAHETSPGGVDWFHTGDGGTLTDEIVTTELAWHMGCRDDKSRLLEVLTGTGSGVVEDRPENCPSACKVCQKEIDEKDKDGWPTTFFGSRETSVACDNGHGTLHCVAETSDEEIKARYARLQWDNYMGKRPIGSGSFDCDQIAELHWEDHMTWPEKRDELLAQAEGWSQAQEEEGMKTSNQKLISAFF